MVTDGIDRVTPTGIVTADGTEHEVDVIVLATGFRAHDYMRPMAITGRDGITLEQAWSDGPRAYRMTAIPGFPGRIDLWPFDRATMERLLAEPEVEHFRVEAPERSAGVP